MTIIYTLSPESIDTDSEEYKIAQKYFELYIQDIGFQIDNTYCGDGSRYWYYTKYIEDINEISIGLLKNDQYRRCVGSEFINFFLTFDKEKISLLDFVNLANVQTLISGQAHSVYYVINDIDDEYQNGKYNSRKQKYSENMVEVIKFLKDNKLLPDSFKY